MTKRKKAGRPVEYSRELPLYDTMEQCSGATGVPVSVLRVAKKNGCPAFTGGRVHFAEFVRWWFSKPDQTAEGEDGIDWAKRDKKATALLKEAKLQEQNERTIDFSLARNFVESLVAHFFGAFERWKQEFPASMKGKTEVEIQQECEREAEAEKKNFSAMLQTWMATKGKSGF